MGGMGSGRRYQGGKDTTSDMRALDVRRLQRDGLLTPGRAFGWNWSRNGETVASIQMRFSTIEVEAMATSGKRWNTRFIWYGRAATWAGSGPGFFVLPVDAGDGWLFSIRGGCSPVGIA